MNDIPPKSGEESKKRNRERGKAFAVLGATMAPRNQYLIEQLEKKMESMSEKMRMSVHKALRGMRKYPLDIISGRQAKEIKGVGNFLARIIDSILSKRPSTARERVDLVSSHRTRESSSGTSHRQSMRRSKQVVLKAEDYINVTTTRCDNRVTTSQFAASADISKLTKAELKKNLQNLRTIERLTGNKERLMETFKIALTKPENSNYFLLPKESKPPKAYLPRYRSGGYAILVAMAEASQEPEYQGFMTKKEICERGKRHADEPFESSYQHYYSSWSSMATLVKHELINRNNTRPVKFHLTSKGHQIAQVLLVKQGSSSSSSLANSKEMSSTLSSSSIYKSSRARGEVDGHVISGSHYSFTVYEEENGADNDDYNCEDIVTLRGQTIRIPPLIGGYELLLIIDNREKKSRIKPTEFSDKLKRLGIAVIMKALPLGDALWVRRLCQTILENRRADL
eukprot:jgi/Bigna1/136419/aug1.33_g11127